jgi:hypothetical protein
MKSIIILTSLLFSSSIFAERQSGSVVGYIPYSNGDKEILIFKLEGNVSGGCNVTARFAIDNTSLRYKTTVSALIAAFHSKAPIAVDYLSSCNSWGNAADVNFIWIGNINC